MLVFRPAAQLAAEVPLLGGDALDFLLDPRDSCSDFGLLGDSVEVVDVFGLGGGIHEAVLAPVAQRPAPTSLRCAVPLGLVAEGLRLAPVLPDGLEVVAGVVLERLGDDLNLVEQLLLLSGHVVKNVHLLALEVVDVALDGVEELDRVLVLIETGDVVAECLDLS